MIIVADSDAELRGYLERLGDAVFDYPTLQGFLFAIACSPEPIPASEWFDMVWFDDGPQFESEEEAKHFFSLLCQVFTDIEVGIAEGRYLPMPCPGNEVEQGILGGWCEGFLLAHQYLEELWNVALANLASDELNDSVVTAINLTTTFCELFLYQPMNDDPVPAMPKEQLNNAFQWLDDVLALYVTVAPLWNDINTAIDAEQLFLEIEPVGRDEPCPCGSGLVFSKCCLH